MFRYPVDASLEFELPEPDLLIFEEVPREWRYPTCFEVCGRVGEMLPVRVWPLIPSDAPRIIGVAWGLVLVPKPVSGVGEPGAEADFDVSDL